MASYYKGTWWFCLAQHLLHFVNGLCRIFVSTDENPAQTPLNVESVVLDDNITNMHHIVHRMYTTFSSYILELHETILSNMLLDIVDEATAEAVHTSRKTAV
jgi:hypothetical protein